MNVPETWRRIGRLTLALSFLGAAVPPSQVAQSIDPAFSCADSVQRALGPFVGIWSVRAIFRSGPSGQDTTMAIATFAPDLQGCLLREHYRGTRYGQPYEFLALWGANGDSGASIQRTFSHSQHGIIGLYRGGWRSDTLTLEETVVVRGERILQQIRATRPGPDGFELEGRRSNDDGASWTVTLRARYARRHQ